MKVKEWKTWLNIQDSKNEDHRIQSHHFLQINGKTMETVRDFIVLGLQITADGDCSHEIKIHLLCREKAMT